MTSQTPIVTGVDFVSVCTSDLAAAMEFNALALHHRYAPRGPSEG